MKQSRRSAAWGISVVTMLVLVGMARPAHADLTAFLGANTSPSNRTVRGVALGVSLLIVGFEFEYADVVEDQSADAPSRRSGMFNLLLQTPAAISGMRFYATAGGGLYRERLNDQGETNVAGNIGGGVKIAISGPIGLRLDYRVFRLAGDARESKPQRVYAGLNVAF